MKNKLFIYSIITLLFLINFGYLSAYTIDNTIDVTNNNYSVNITNSFGFGDTIAELQLLTPLDNHVGLGYQEVAEYSLIYYLDNNGWLDELNLYDKNNKMKEIYRDYDYKVKTIVNESVNDYELVCSNSLLNNSKDCVQEITGTHLEETESWVDLNDVEFVKGQKYILGIFTNVEDNDKVEWIPDYFGVKIDEWATWTADLNVNLMSYYKFDGSNTTVIDSTGNFTGTYSGTYEGLVGKINNSYGFTGTEYVSGVADMKASSNGAVGFWIYPTLSSDYYNIYATWQASHNTQIRTTNGGIVQFVREENPIQLDCASYTENVWNFYVLTWNSTGFYCYKNGAFTSNKTDNKGWDDLGSEVRIGKSSSITYGANARLDEMFFYNRTLTATEINYLWNNGDGLTYAPVYVNSPPHITLNSPNSANYTSPQSLVINFTAYDDVQLSNVTLYVNGVLNQTNSSGLNNTDYLFNLNLGDGDYYIYGNATDNESATSNSSTIRIFIDSMNPSINITSPLESYDYLYNNQTLDLNYSISDTNLRSCWYNYNGVNTTLNCSTNTTFNYVAGVNNLTLYANDSLGNLNTSIREWNIKVLELSRNSSSSVFETQSTTYTINLTTNSSLSSVNLSYNSVNLPMTYVDNGFWTYTRDAPLELLGNESIGYNFLYGDEVISSTKTTYQYVNPLNFTLCSGSNNVNYLTINFEDESDMSTINASIPLSTFDFYLGSGGVTKEYDYSTSTDNEKYSFCSSAYNDTLYVSPYLQYKQGSTYPQRIYEPSTLTLTNATTNKTLYLLSSTYGIYSTFQVVDVTNRPLSGVDATAVREISGEDVTIGTGITDASGAITFWVNPDFLHTFTFSKEGYGSITYSVTPTQSSYTITLGANTSQYETLSSITGLKWYAFPSAGIINNTELRNYGFNITSNNNSLVKCRIDLITKDKTATLASAESDAVSSGFNCLVSVAYSASSSNSTFKGRLLVDLGSGWQQLEDDINWRLEEIDTTGSTFSDFFNGLTSFDLRYFNENENHREYTYILSFFLIITIICGVLNYAGWEIQTRGGMIYLIGILVWIASFTGFLTLNGATLYSEIDKYFLAFLYSLFMIGWGFRHIG